MKLRLASLWTIATLVLSLTVTPAFAAEKLMAIDDTSSVWIVGTDVNGYGCWSLPSSKMIPTLQVKVRGKWVTKSKAKLSKKSSLCKDKKYPWVATYHWKVDELGETPHGSNLSRDIVAREFLPKIGYSPAFAGTPFVKQVYRNEDDLMSDYSSVIDEELGGISGGGSSSFGSSSKFAGCMFKGKKLYGKVQIVDYFPDLKVQIVDYFPDLKIQFVDYFADVKIQFVDYFPGLP